MRTEVLNLTTSYQSVSIPANVKRVCLVAGPAPLFFKDPILGEWKYLKQGQTATLAKATGGYRCQFEAKGETPGQYIVDFAAPGENVDRRETSTTVYVPSPSVDFSNTYIDKAEFHFQGLQAYTIPTQGMKTLYFSFRKSGNNPGTVAVKGVLGYIQDFPDIYNLKGELVTSGGALITPGGSGTGDAGKIYRVDVGGYDVIIITSANNNEDFYIKPRLTQS